MNEEAYKAYSKLRVILFALVYYTVIIILLSWGTWALIGLLKISSPLIWQWHWWQIVLFAIIQYVYSAIMYGVILGAINVVKKNKDFFLR